LLNKKMLFQIGAVLSMCLFALAGAINPVTDASATPQMGNDCYASGCHTAGKPLTKENLQQKPPTPASAPKPAPAAPAPIAPSVPASAKPILAPAPAKGSGEVKIAFNGQTRVFTGMVKGDTILLPLRETADFFGASLAWNNQTKTANIAFGDIKASLRANQPMAAVDGREVKLAVAPVLTKGRIMAPLTLLAEVFGMTVSGDVKTGISATAPPPVSREAQKKALAGLYYRGDGTTASIPSGKSITSCGSCHQPGKQPLVTCATCHSSMTQERIRIVQNDLVDQYFALQKELAAIQAKYNGAGSAAKQAAKGYLDAVSKNMALFAEDKSDGIHNPAFFRAMFIQVKQDLTILKSLLP